MKQYKEGSFGYYWTVELGNEDIGGIDYDGNIDALCFYGSSLDGLPNSVGGDLDLYAYNGSSLEGLPNSVGGSLLLQSYNGSSLIGLPNSVGGDLDLYAYNGSSLEGLPNSVGGSLLLLSYNGSSLDGLPNSIGGSLLLQSYNGSSLEGLPNSVGGSLLLQSYNGSSLEGLPNSVGGSLLFLSYNGSSLDGLPNSVGGDLWLNSYNGSSLEGLPNSVGGSLCLQSYNGESIPDDMEVDGRIYANVHRYKGKLMSFFDGIQKEVKSSRSIGSITVYEMVDGTFAVYDGEYYAHGKTLEQAKNDLRYKRSTRDLTMYESMGLDTELSLDDMITAYRSITGACSAGTKWFVEGLSEVPDRLTIADAINMTVGQYRNDVFAKFFEKGN